MALSSVSRRERLVQTAIRLGVSFPPSITDDNLRLLIDAQPASRRQRKVLEAYLRPLKRKLPAGMTYGQARKVLVQVRETLNKYAIEQMELAEGTILHWKDEYYYVMRISGPNSEYMIVMRRVKLSRPPGAAEAVVRAAGTEFRINPVNLLFACFTVDRRTWRPDFKSSPLIDPDEPMF